jgi:hypothetical protein
MELGFGPSPRPKKIYLNRQYPDCLWYFWDFEANKHIPIAHESITGYLTKVEIDTKEFKGKENQKINLSLNCGRMKYILVVGLDTFTAKGLLNALASGIDLKAPITIAPEAGDTENVLFAKVYREDGENIYVPQEQQREPIDALGALIAQLGGVPKQPAPTAVKPSLPAVPKTTRTIDASNLTITEQQRQELIAIAKSHNWAVPAIQAYLKACGYSHSRLIQNKDFQAICEGFGQADISDYYHETTAVPATQTLPLGEWEVAS